jgi:DNA-binding NarL/FixJ family response regulator
MNKIKLILADDQTLITQSLKIVLETQSDEIQVIGVAEDGFQVLELVKRNSPDLILMDVRMPRMDGVEATRIITQSGKNIKIIMLTTFDDYEYVREAMKAGAVGYLLKDISTDELIAAVKAAFHGAVLISPTIVAKLFTSGGKGYITHNKLSLPEAPDWYEELTDREKTLLYLVGRGFTNKEIAGELFLAEQTVKNYLSVLYEKIGVEDRTQTRRMLSEFNLI